MRWSPGEIAAATSGTLVGAARPGELRAVVIDSRLVSGGELFVAIKAERDGHDFVEAALEAGAGAVLADATKVPVDAGVPVVAVRDTAAALLDLGRAARRRLGGDVVGITGSVGKTSTKDLAAAALGAGLRVAASEKSFNNELGVPLTLANAPESTEVAVIEMGARGPGHIALLCEVARPSVAVVTSVAAAHTEVFGDLAGVAAAKGELVEALPRAGTAILNGDDPLVAEMGRRGTAAVLRYSAAGVGGWGADLLATAVTLDDQLRPSFAAETPWGKVGVVLEARGVHQVGNALAALAVACVCGVDIGAASEALGSARLSPWRMEMVRTPGGATVLNDAYNANPTSMAAALRALAALPVRRRVAVLGVMAELGERSAEEHLAVSRLAEGLGVRVVAVGTDAYGVDPVGDVDAAITALGPLGEGDAVLVKASRVVGLELLAERLVAQRR